MIVIRLLLRFILVPLGASVAWLVAAAVVLISQWGKLMLAVNDQAAGENFWVLLLVIGPIYILVWRLILSYFTVAFGFLVFHRWVRRGLKSFDRGTLAEPVGG